MKLVRLNAAAFKALETFEVCDCHVTGIFELLHHGIEAHLMLAEVMVSFRAATDRTHITQLLGRMVRTPLARRIPGNDRLNAVDCLLPRFDRKSVEAVVTALMTGGDAGEDLPLRRILIKPIDVTPNPDIAEEVWEKLLSLPSQTLPKKQARPVKRLTALAHELAVDGLLPGAGAKAHAEMHKVLDQAQATYADRIKAARAAVLTVEGTTLSANIETQVKTFNDFVEAADYAVIEDAYKRAARVISPDLARTYAEHLAAKDEDAEDVDEALIDAHTTIAAMGLKTVLATEMKSDDRVAWYRNPDRAAQESLGIVYDEAGTTKILRPDFVFFSQAADGSIAADIVDPHGHHLADALPKLRGLARYAEINGALFRRIEAVSEIKGKYRMLDLKKAEVRNALDLATTTAEPVYLGPMGTDYAV